MLSLLTTFWRLWFFDRRGRRVLRHCRIRGLRRISRRNFRRRLLRLFDR
jgi:hypothetical protein